MISTPMLKSRILWFLGVPTLVLLAAAFVIAVTIGEHSGDDADAADAAAVAVTTNLARCRIAAMGAFPAGAASNGSSPEHIAYQNYVSSCMEGRGYRYGGESCFGEAVVNNANCYERPTSWPSEFRRWASRLDRPGTPLTGNSATKSKV
jgi:hypothetical protein